MKLGPVVFSDVHLGYSRSNTEEFGQFVEFLERNLPERVVIAGDFLDLWRRTNAEIVIENRKVLSRLFSLDCPIDYVVGNHDFALLDIAKGSRKNILNQGGVRYSRELRFHYGNNSYYVTHGHIFDIAVTKEGMDLATYEAFAQAMCKADNTVGGAASIFWDGVTHVSPSHWGMFATKRAPDHSDEEYRDIANFAASGAAHLFCGAQPQDHIIFGHTHWPFINKKRTVANTGSWCTSSSTPECNTYIQIDEEEGMFLQHFF